MINGLKKLPIWQYWVARQNLWKMLHQTQPHPVSRQIQRQLDKQSQFPILIFNMGWGIFIFAMVVALYSQIGQRIMPLVPLILMIWSGGYIFPWLYHISDMVKRQHNHAVMQTLGVIPLGTVFVRFAICHAVLNTGDSLGWLGIIRRLVSIMLILTLGFAAIIAFFQIPQMDTVGLLRFILDLFLIAALIYLEHQQSILLLCYLPAVVPRWIAGYNNLIFILSLVMVLIQFGTWTIPTMILLVTIDLRDVYLSASILVFLLLREVILLVLSQLAQN